MNIDMPVTITIGVTFQLRPEFLDRDNHYYPVVELWLDGSLRERIVVPGFEFEHTDKPGFVQRNCMIIARGCIGLIKGELEMKYRDNQPLVNAEIIRDILTTYTDTSNE